MQHSLASYIHELTDTTTAKVSIERDLQIAHTIQMALLPKTFPPFPDRSDIDVYGLVQPAKEVGGDLFDFFIRDEKLFFCIGDVSGKGVPSAIVMAMVQKLFRVTTAHETNPASILEELNKELSRDNTTNMFITFFLGILDLPTGRLRYCNAGHDHPIIVECGKEEGVQILSVKAHLPLGVISDYKYLSEECVLPDESILFLYTDGLTEAKDIQRQQFKLQRVTDTLTHCTQRSAVSAQELLTMMTEEVNRFVGDAEQSDDLSMLAIGYQRPVIKEKVNQSITLQNDVTQITQLNTFVKQFLTQAGLDRKETLRLQLALEEVVVNVMNYAYPPESHGDIIVEAALNENRIKFTISDSGAAFDPTTEARNVDTTLSAEERPIGGLGILLIRKLVDSINYERINGRNILTLRKMMQHE
jgi:sigma-B regulation protein RsbU (phosphoserine phosphatase)